MGYINIAELGHDDVIGCRRMREEDVKGDDGGAFH